MDEADIRADGDGEEEEQDPEADEIKYPTLGKSGCDDVRRNFGYFDKESTGYIESQSLGTVLRYCKFNPNEIELTEFVKIHDPLNNNHISIENVLSIAEEKSKEPDTIDEFIEAAKIFDHDKDGKIEIAELRYAMSTLGDKLEENVVDDLIAELDKDKTGLIDIAEWARITFK